MKKLIPHIANTEKYRDHVVKPLAVLSAAALIASGINYEVEKDKDHSIAYLHKDKQVTVPVHGNEGPSALIAEVDGTNLDPQTYADLQKYVLEQGQGRDAQGNPQLVDGQSAQVPDVHKH